MNKSARTNRTKPGQSGLVRMQKPDGHGHTPLGVSGLSDCPTWQGTSGAMARRGAQTAKAHPQQIFFKMESDHG
jgi:hypothetical protein